MRGLLDTSIFIGLEQSRGVTALPDDSAISVMTLAELRVGVLIALGRDEEESVIALRIATLNEVDRTFDALPVDRDVANAFAALVSRTRLLGRRPKVVDSIIAATAVAHGLTIYTQDADFDDMPGLSILRV